MRPLEVFLMKVNLFVFYLTSVKVKRKVKSTSSPQDIFSTKVPIVKEQILGINIRG